MPSPRARPGVAALPLCRFTVWAGAREGSPPRQALEPGHARRHRHHAAERGRRRDSNIRSLEGDDAGARAAFERARALNPSLHEAFHYYGRHCYALGDFAKAATLLEQAFNLRPDQYTVLGLALSALEATGDTARSRAMSLRVRDGLRPNEFATLYNVACNYARAGECDLALELLERAVQLGSGYLEWFEHDPDLANLRENPRFQHLLEQLRAARDSAASTA